MKHLILFFFTLLSSICHSQSKITILIDTCGTTAASSQWSNNTNGIHYQNRVGIGYTLPNFKLTVDSVGAGSLSAPSNIHLWPSITSGNPVLYWYGRNASGNNLQVGRIESKDYGVANNNIVLGAGSLGAPNIRLQVDNTAAHIGFNIGGTPNSLVTVMNTYGGGTVHFRSPGMLNQSNTDEAIVGRSSTTFNINPGTDAIPVTILKTNSSTAPAFSIYQTGTSFSTFLITGDAAMQFGPGGNGARDVGFRRSASGVLEINSTVYGQLRDLSLRGITATGQINNSGSSRGYVAARWTTANRPASPLLGEEGYNIDDNKKEYWNGSVWVQY